MTETDTRTRVQCAVCGTEGRAHERHAAGWKCTDHRPPSTRDPEARNVDWPALVGRCERKGVPVSRVDERGEVHIIRTRAQLESEWEQ